MGTLWNKIEGVLFTPKMQVRIAWFNLFGSLPFLIITFFIDGDFQLLLTTFLSVYAITLTALGFLSSAQANKKVESIQIDAENADVDAGHADINAKSVIVSSKPD